MNKQIEIQNLETLIAFWQFAILSHEQEIDKIQNIIRQLEAQVEQLRAKNDLENQGF